MVVFPVELPPLRDRADDIVPLASHFLQEICASFGREPLHLSRQHSSVLMQHDWPGNVRELKNVLERSVILSRGNRLRLDLAMIGGRRASVREPPAGVESPAWLTEDEFRNKEKENIIAVLSNANWQVWGEDGAAAMLGVKPSTLAYRMKTFGISNRNR